MFSNSVQTYVAEIVCFREAFKHFLEYRDCHICMYRVDWWVDGWCRGSGQMRGSGRVGGVGREVVGGWVGRQQLLVHTLHYYPDTVTI